MCAHVCVRARARAAGRLAFDFSARFTGRSDRTACVRRTAQACVPYVCVCACDPAVPHNKNVAVCGSAVCGHMRASCSSGAKQVLCSVHISCVAFSQGHPLARQERKVSVPSFSKGPCPALSCVSLYKLWS